MKGKTNFLIIGCGFAGATFANLAAVNGFTSHIIDQRNHIGGNSYSYEDQESGVEVHKYGPHIFHTNSAKVWNYLNQFTRFNNYVNRVKALSNGMVYPMPINLFTINQFFGESFNPQQAEDFIGRIRQKIPAPKNFEEHILSTLGEDLYKAFFKNYTQKHWGVHPREIPISTAKRLPIRFNYNDNYFNDIYQGIPEEGYTVVFERMLKHENIAVKLDSSFDEYRHNWREKYDYLIYTGSMDEYFDYTAGFLPYRTLTFKPIRGKDIQGTAVMNYTDMSKPFTRIHEHKWFTPEKEFRSSIAFEEYPSFTDSRKNPIYPIHNAQSQGMLKVYSKLGKEEKNVIFLGRLAEFRYYDMHQVVASSMSKFENLMKSI